MYESEYYIHFMMIKIRRIIKSMNTLYIITVKNKANSYLGCCDLKKVEY